MNPPPPLVTRPDQLGPYTTLVRLHRADPARTPDGARGGPVAPRARAGPATGSWHEPMRVTESHLRTWSLLQVSNGSCAVGMAMAGLVLGRGVNGLDAKLEGSKWEGCDRSRSGGLCEKGVEN